MQADRFVFASAEDGFYGTVYPLKCDLFKKVTSLFGLFFSFSLLRNG